MIHRNFNAWRDNPAMMNRSCLLFALIALSACGQQDAAARFAEAKAAFAAQDYAHARSAVLAALDADRDNRAMLWLLAHADLELGDGEGATAALKRLADAGATGQDLTELAAQAALLRRQRTEMETILGTDQSPVAWRLRGEAALAEKDGATALTDFQHGMAAGDDYQLALDYARFLFDDDDIDGAERALAVMRKLAPDRLETRMVAGLIAQSRSHYDEAEQIFSDAAKRFPTRADPLVALADLADLRSHSDLTARYAAQAVALAPDDRLVASLILRVAAEKGDWAKVRDMLAPREATLDDRTFEGMAYGEALLNLQHAEQARAIFQKALLLSPQNPYARIMLTRCDLAVHDGAGALKTIRPMADSVLAGPRELDLAIQAAGMARDPVAKIYAQRRNSPQLAASNAAANQALAATARRDWAGVLAAYGAIPGADGDGEVLKRMALAASNLGQADVALRDADRALELAPANPDMLHIAGLVRLNAGRDRAMAHSLLKQALERDPANRVFRADYARSGG